MDFVSTIQVVLGAAGGSAVVMGLGGFTGKLWVEKQKAEYLTLLERLKASLDTQARYIQASIDKSVFVTRAHFETEFDAMKQVYKALTDSRLAMNTLRPTFSVEPHEEDEEEKRRRLGQRLDSLILSRNKLLETIEALRPFYSRELYEHAEEAFKATSNEVVSVQSAGSETFLSNWYQEGDTNRTRFDAAYFKAADAIQNRLSRMAVLEK